MAVSSASVISSSSACWSRYGSRSPCRRTGGISASVNMACAPLPRSARIRPSGDRHGAVPRRRRATIRVGDGLEEAFPRIERQLRSRALPRGRVDSLAGRGLEEVREPGGGFGDQPHPPGQSSEDAVQARPGCEVGSGYCDRGGEVSRRAGMGGAGRPEARPGKGSSRVQRTRSPARSSSGLLR